MIPLLQEANSKLLHEEGEKNEDTTASGEHAYSAIPTFGSLQRKSNPNRDSTKHVHSEKPAKQTNTAA